MIHISGEGEVGGTPEQAVMRSLKMTNGLSLSLSFGKKNGDNGLPGRKLLLMETRTRRSGSWAATGIAY